MVVEEAFDTLPIIMFPYRRMPAHITGLYLFTVVNVLILCHITLVHGEIIVLSRQTNQTVDGFNDLPAYFGPPIPDVGIKGVVVYSNPPDACKAIAPPPASDDDSISWFVLIKRSNCSFSLKVTNAQLAGYNAAIVHNVGSNNLEPMGPDTERNVAIQSVFIGYEDGNTIRQKYTFEKGFTLIITAQLPFNIKTYLLPFSIAVAVCFVVLLSVMITKCIRDRRKNRRHRLSPKLLKHLVVKKFKKGDNYDVCAICLDEYSEGEKLRILPCSHAYHMKCIDPWLTGSRYTCPMCKRRVILGEETSDSDDDSEAGTVNEASPLLTPQTTDSNPPRYLVNRVAINSVNSEESVLTENGDGASSDTSSTDDPFGPCDGRAHSSGEHSVNGEPVDFRPFSNADVPVEIAVDAGLQPQVHVSSRNRQDYRAEVV